MARKGIMLAYPFEEKRFKKWGNKAIIQPKLNGERCRAVIDKYGSVLLRSSQDNEIPFMDHIISSLRNTQLRDIELDGELYLHGMPLQQIHSIVSRRVNPHSHSRLVEFHVFDIINQERQYKRINDLLTFRLDSNVKRVPCSIVASSDEIERELNRYIEDGYEGFILRNINALYTRKRSTNIMKCKPSELDEYNIVGSIEEHTIEGEPKNALGALVLSKDGQVFNVGTGFTRKQRIALWETRDTLPGKICVVKYQALTEKGLPVPGVFVKVKEATND